MAVIDIVLGFFKVVTIVYDIVTFPIYGIAQQSWRSRSKQNLGSVRISLIVNFRFFDLDDMICFQVSALENSKEAVSFRREKGNSPIYNEIIVSGKVDTVTKAFNFAVGKYGDRTCLGTREVLGEEDEVQSNGKVRQSMNDCKTGSDIDSVGFLQVFKKLALGDYQWITYNQLAATVESFGRGLRRLGQDPGSSIAIYAETRAEWMMSCLGAFSQVIIYRFLITMRVTMSTFSEHPCLHGVHQPWRRCCRSRYQRNQRWDCCDQPWAPSKIPGHAVKVAQDQAHHLPGGSASGHSHYWIQGWRGNHGLQNGC